MQNLICAAFRCRLASFSGLGRGKKVLCLSFFYYWGITYNEPIFERILKLFFFYLATFVGRKLPSFQFIWSVKHLFFLREFCDVFDCEYYAFVFQIVKVNCGVLVYFLSDIWKCCDLHRMCDAVFDCEYWAFVFQIFEFNCGILVYFLSDNQ